MCHAEWLIAEFPHQGAKSITISYPPICAAESHGWWKEGMPRRKRQEGVKWRQARRDTTKWEKSSIEQARLKRKGADTYIAWEETQGWRDSEGRKWEQKSAIDCRLCTCHTERKKYQTKWNVIIWEETGRFPDSSPARATLAVIHHSLQHSSTFISTYPERNSSDGSTCKRNNSGLTSITSHTGKKSLCSLF